VVLQQELLVVRVVAADLGEFRQVVVQETLLLQHQVKVTLVVQAVEAEVVQAVVQEQLGAIH
jgi:hypothetical protein